MADLRAVRLAENEAIFRSANERIAEWEERHEGGRADSYYCECSDPACRAKVTLERSAYEAVREDSMQFVLATGHADLSVERIVARNEGYDVVRKDEEVRDVVEDSDPRRQ